MTAMQLDWTDHLEDGRRALASAAWEGAGALFTAVLGEEEEGR